MHRTKKILCVLLSVLMIASAMALAASAAQTDSEQLKFNADGKFTILNFSDIQDRYPMKSITKDLIKDTIARVNPDLIVLTGDNISGGSVNTNTLARAAIREFMQIFEDAGIPTAAVFGNHDNESLTATKEFQMSCYESYNCFVGCAGEDMSGCGTYNLPILSSDGSRYAFNLWFTDSGTYNTENDLGGYACVQKDQIEWYKAKSSELKAQNNGNPVPSINFQHIIVPEIFEALENTGSGYVLPEGAEGELNENPCPPKYSNGQFAAFLEQGDVLATVSGHDHVNTFKVNYKGIDIINTPGTGFYSYDSEVVGSRVFVLDENEPENYETYCLSYFDIYSYDDDVARYRFKANSDTTSNATKFAAMFKYIFALIASIFK